MVFFNLQVRLVQIDRAGSQVPSFKYVFTHFVMNYLISLSIFISAEYVMSAEQKQENKWKLREFKLNFADANKMDWGSTNGEISVDYIMN